MKKHNIKNIGLFLSKEVVDAYYMHESFTHFYKDNETLIVVGPDLCCKVTNGDHVSILARTQGKQYPGITNGILSQILTKHKIKPNMTRSRKPSPIEHLLGGSSQKNFMNMFV